MGVRRSKATLRQPPASARAIQGPILGKSWGTIAPAFT